MLKNNYFFRIIQFGLVLVVLSALLFTATGVVYAILYDISTTDGSVSDWDGIPVFQDDDTGDVENPSEDIDQTWVASGPTSASTAETVYFRMKTVSALTDNRGAVAALDCNNNGVYDDPEDRLIVYIPYCNNGAQVSERATIVWGDQYMFGMLGPDSGQIIGNEVEWSVPVSDLPPDENHPDVDCRNEVNIRFYTSDNTVNCVFPYTGLATTIDETPGGPYYGLNIPTMIKLQEMHASTGWNYGTAVAFVISILGGMGLLALALWRQRWI